MKIIKTISLFILLFTFTFSFSQMRGLGALKDLEMVNILNNPEGKETINLDKISGSPYLEEQFVKGILGNKGDDEKLSLYIRYNVFSDNFEVKYNITDSKVTIIDRTNKFDIALRGKKFIFTQSNYIFKETGTGYLGMLSDPDAKHTLYKRYYSEYTPEQAAANTYAMAKPAKVETKYNYYLKNNETGKFTMIEDHRKRIIEDLPMEFQSKVKSFIKKNNLKMRGEEVEVEADMREVVDYINTL